MAKQLTDIHSVPKVRLTPTVLVDPPWVAIPLSEMICYSQEIGFTRLRLTGGQTLDVKETTERIDQLVRQASSRG